MVLSRKPEEEEYDGETNKRKESNVISNNCSEHEIWKERELLWRWDTGLVAGRVDQGNY